MSDRTLAQRSFAEVTFTPDPGYKLLFEGMRAHENLGRPFIYDLDLSSSEPQDVGKIVGQSGTVWLTTSAQGVDDRYFNGIVTRAVSCGLFDGAYRYRVELRPWVWLLSRVMDCRIFQNKSAFDIITTIFRDAGFSDFEDKRQAQSGDTVLEYCVQYRESSLDFITRLMERYGLYYFFTHTDGNHKLIIADDPTSHEKLSDSIPFNFDHRQSRTVADHIMLWQRDVIVHSGKFSYQDYNFTTPSADLSAKTVYSASYMAAHSDSEVYDYPGPYDDAGVGKKLTDVRMQAISKNGEMFDAMSNSRLLHSGHSFTLERHPMTAYNRSYLIISSEFTVNKGEASAMDEHNEGESRDTYAVTLRCIPDDKPFRLECETLIPKIYGPQTARVVGASGEEIDTDQYGRVKVKFHWDRADVEDDQRTCWIRVAQMMAGAKWGAIFIPRIGQEVVVEFLEGNPDRPLITGVVYNANNGVPYTLPDNKTQTGYKSNSSKNASGSNEFRFEDKAGEEEVFFHAQKDYKKVVLNNETVEVTKDTTTTIKEGNRKVTVSQGNDDHTVSQGNRSATISQGNESTTVSAGNHSLSVSAGKSEITAAQSITLTVGGNSIKIDTSGVTINGIQVKVQSSATMSVQAGAPLSMSAPMISLN